MGKRTPDLLDSMLPKKDTQQPTEASTNTPQTPDIHSTKAALKRYDVRFAPDDWKWLKSHFRTKGLTVSAGLRMIVKEYIGREGV